MGFDDESRYDYGSSYPPPRIHENKKLWDPKTTLKIINPDRGSLTCVGYAPSCGRRCRNPINQGNRASASRILDDLSYIDTSTTNIKAQLRQLAGLTLCLRYHQDQQSDMVNKWSRVISQLQPTYQSQAASKYSPDIKAELDRLEERNRYLEELLASISHGSKQNDGFGFSSPIGERYQKEYKSWQSAQAEREREQREQEKRKAKEREYESQQQEREKRKQEERERKKREEEERKKQEERERKKREEEERKKQEEREQKERKEKEERAKRREEKRRQEEQQTREREAREREERNERVRQRAENIRKERERKAREEAEKARKEWDMLWLRYVRRWDDLKKNPTRGTSEKLRETIPWPVKSGSWKDVSESAVEEFFRNAPPQDNSVEKMFLIMKMECLKWHADRVPRMFGVIEDKTLASLFTTVAQVAIKIRAEKATQR